MNTDNKNILEEGATACAALEAVVEKVKLAKQENAEYESLKRGYAVFRERMLGVLDECNSVLKGANINATPSTPEELYDACARACACAIAGYKQKDAAVKDLCAAAELQLKACEYARQSLVNVGNQLFELCND